jgi:hypothetical protein
VPAIGEDIGFWRAKAKAKYSPYPASLQERPSDPASHPESPKPKTVTRSRISFPASDLLFKVGRNLA